MDVSLSRDRQHSSAHVIPVQYKTGKRVVHEQREAWPSREVESLTWITKYMRNYGTVRRKSLRLNRSRIFDLVQEI